MKYIHYNGQALSKLALGTVQLGLKYGLLNTAGKPSFKTSSDILNYVHHEGINTIDTAYNYGDAHQVLGKVFKNNKNIFLVTKLASEQFKNKLLITVSEILINLQRKQLDGLLLHDSELLNMWNEEYSASVNMLKNKKFIRYFGVSVYSSVEFNLAIENQDIDIIQIPFNIFDQRAIYERWFEQAQKRGKLLFIRSIYLQGLLLADKNHLPLHLSGAKFYLEKLEDHAKLLNMSISQLALNFVESIAKESIILFGCNSLETAKKSIENYKNTLDLDTTVLESLAKEFRNIDEQIYNPKKW